MSAPAGDPIAPVDEFVCNAVVDLVFHWYDQAPPGQARQRPALPAIRYRVEVIA
jgi:hypothetical protein